MCFVRAWKTGLDARARVESLSDQRIGGLGRKIPKSLRTIRIHKSSDVVEARLRYSASVDERDTVFCFFETQVMGVEPRKTILLDVDRRLTGFPA
jgi:hypothetical protein